MEHTILTFDQSSKLSLSLEALTGLQELGYGGFLATEYVRWTGRVAIAPTTSRQPFCCGEHWSRPLPK